MKVTYKTKAVEMKAHKPNHAMSVDLGINNLMTVANNIDIQCLIIKGKVLKSFNQYFNKKLAKLKSQLDTAKAFLKPSIQRKLNRLNQKRKHKINADVNGAFNILRKVIGDFTFDPIQVYSTPKMVNVLK